VSPVRHDKLHLTLHFLGQVPRARLPELGQGLAVPFEPFDLNLHYGELWPGGIAVMRPASTPPALRALHERLHRALDRLQLPSSRQQLQPHVTLARRAQGAVPPARREDIGWAVDGFVLVESALRRSQYQLVHRYP
jgi:2'-5' RNA ligase